MKNNMLLQKKHVCSGGFNMTVIKNFNNYPYNTMT